MSITELTESLQFRSQAMAFAIFSSGIKPFTVKEEVEFQKDSSNDIVGIKAKPTMSITELTESLQFRSQAMAFAIFSSGIKPFTVKEEVEFQKELQKDLSKAN